MAETVSSIAGSPAKLQTGFVLDPEMSPDPVVCIWPGADASGRKRPQTIRADEVHVVSLTAILDELAESEDPGEVAEIAAYLHYHAIRLGNRVGMFDAAGAQSAEAKKD